MKPQRSIKIRRSVLVLLLFSGHAMALNKDCNHLLLRQFDEVEMTKVIAQIKDSNQILASLEPLGYRQVSESSSNVIIFKSPTGKILAFDHPTPGERVIKYSEDFKHSLSEAISRDSDFIDHLSLEKLQAYSVPDKTQQWWTKSQDVELIQKKLEELGWKVNISTKDLRLDIENPFYKNAEYQISLSSKNSKKTADGQSLYNYLLDFQSRIVSPQMESKFGRIMNIQTSNYIHSQLAEMGYKQLTNNSQEGIILFKSPSGKILAFEHPRHGEKVIEYSEDFKQALGNAVSRDRDFIDQMSLGKIRLSSVPDKTQEWWTKSQDVDLIQKKLEELGWKVNVNTKDLKLEIENPFYKDANYQVSLSPTNLKKTTESNTLYNHLLDFQSRIVSPQVESKFGRIMNIQTSNYIQSPLKDMGYKQIQTTPGAGIIIFRSPTGKTIAFEHPLPGDKVIEYSDDFKQALGNAVSRDRDFIDQTNIEKLQAYSLPKRAQSWTGSSDVELITRKLEELGWRINTSTEKLIMELENPFFQDARFQIRIYPSQGKYRLSKDVLSVTEQLK
jgi:hypothetical protein